MKLLNKFIRFRGEGESIEDVHDDNLPDLLENFFSEVNKPTKKDR